MNIIQRIREARYTHLSHKGENPSRVYLGSREKLELTDWAMKNLFKTSEPAGVTKVEGMPVYFVQEDTHLFIA